MQQYFFHDLTRKYIEAFGSIFNDIWVVTYNQSRTTEIKRTKVPIVFGSREKYLIRTNEKERRVSQTLPIMSYNIVGMAYDASKKTNALHRIPRANNVSGNADSVYNGVPYVLNFDLSILTRNKEDAWQILEQIIPSFHPSFTFSQLLIPEIGIIKDIPVTLETINQTVNSDGDADEILSVELTLSFRMDVHYFGPVTRTKIIKTAFANTFLDPSLYAGAIVRANLSNGNNGIYNIDDLVYQGENAGQCTAAGIVTRWDANNSYIIIGAVQGNFRTNTTIKALSTNASYTLETFDVNPLKVQSIKIEPDPITATANDDYGFTETILEYPDTLDG